MLCTSLLGPSIFGLGYETRAQAVLNSFQTGICSHRPVSVYECLWQIRRLSELQQGLPNAGLIDTLRFIIQNPRKLPLLKAFVLAGHWGTLENPLENPLEILGISNGHGFVNALEIEPVSLRLAARDEVRECLEWEASLTPTMKAARRGDFATFQANVSADPKVLDMTDSLGHDVLFWALTGGHIGIIIHLLNARASLQRLLSLYTADVLYISLFAQKQQVQTNTKPAKPATIGWQK